MEIRYVGPFESVEVDGLGVVTKGEATPCPAELGKSLCEQVDNWQPVKAAAKVKES